MSEPASMQALLEAALATKKDAKRRDGIINHLSMILGKVSEDSEIKLCGGSAAGISPRRGGIEVAIIPAEGVSVKDLTKSFARKVNGWGLSDVIVLEKRQIPFIRGRSDRTGIPVIISIADPTAEHQVRLLQLCVDSDQRVRGLLNAINNWVLHRSLGQSEGGLYPMAWNILGLTHLRRQGLLGDPFLCDSEPQVLAGGRSLDVGMVSDAAEMMLAEQLDINVESLFRSFMAWLSRFELPLKEVISLRHPDGVARVEVAMKAPDLGKARKRGRPSHLWPLLHPFDIQSDLSDFLTIDGAKKIIAEASRVVDELSVEDIFETLNPNSLAEDVNRDLFADLREMAEHEVVSELKAQRRAKTIIEAEVESIQKERQAQIRIAQALRGLVKDTRGLKREHRQVIREMPKRRSEMDGLRKRRDEINSKVVLPTVAIEEEVSKVYEKLTGEARGFRYPSLAEEKRLFSYFLELQSMYVLALESTECHQKFQLLAKEQRAAVKLLKSFEAEHQSLKQEAMAEVIGSEELKGENHELKTLDNRISKLLQSLNSKRVELRESNREIGRLDAWLRIQKKSGERSSKPKGAIRSRHLSPDVDLREVKRKAASGESMSLEDFDALLSSGGLSSVSPEQDKPSKSRRRKAIGQKKVGATLGKRATGRPDLEGRGNQRRL